MGMRHIRAARLVHGVEISGIVDLDSSMRVRLQGDGHLVWPNLESAFASDSFDAAIVATPPASLASIAQALVLHGVHVLVEKPFVINSLFQNGTPVCSDDSPVIVQVGFVERFARFSGEIDRLIYGLDAFPSQPPNQVTLAIRRSSARPQWHCETDPLRDLACHDLDHLERNGVTIRSRTMDHSASSVRILGELWRNGKLLSRLDALAQWGAPAERKWSLNRPNGLSESLRLDASADFGTLWDPLARQLTQFRDSCSAHLERVSLDPMTGLEASQEAENRDRS